MLNGKVSIKLLSTLKIIQIVAPIENVAARDSPGVNSIKVEDRGINFTYYIKEK